MENVAADGLLFYIAAHSGSWLLICLLSALSFFLGGNIHHGFLLKGKKTKEKGVKERIGLRCFFLSCGLDDKDHSWIFCEMLENPFRAYYRTPEWCFLPSESSCSTFHPFSFPKEGSANEFMTRRQKNVDQRSCQYEGFCDPALKSIRLRLTDDVKTACVV